MKETRRHGAELSRDLGLYSVFTTATGTMIGAGIFVLPGLAAEGAGPGAAISFLLAGGIAMLAALAVCELATAMPRAGGDYYFVSRAMGPLLGTMVGLGAWLALIFKGAFALVGLGQYVLHFSPVPVLLTAVGSGVLLLLVNLVGARSSGLLQNLVVLPLLLILGAFTIQGLFAADVELIRAGLPLDWPGIFATTGVVFISYLGVVKAAAVAEEVIDPGRNLPLGILSSVVLVTLLYVSTMLIVTGVLPLPEIIAADAPLADAATLFLGVTGGVLVGIAGILATLSTGNAAILSSSRYPFAMARDALMTPWISQVHKRFRTPSRSILVTGGVMILLVLVLDVESLAKLGGVFGMVIFALVNLSVLFLRRSAPPWYKPVFKVPFYPVLPMIGVVVALAPILQLDLASQLTAVGFVGLGVAWFYIHRSLALRAGKQVQPNYGLFDRFERLRQVQALEEKRRVLEEPTTEVDRGTVIIAELTQEGPYTHLLDLAAALARRYLAPLDVLVITLIPDQSPLEGPTEALSPEWVAEIEARMEGHGVPLRLHHVLARDRAHAILGFVEPETRAVLLDWHREFRLLRLSSGHEDSILRQSPSRVALFKDRSPRAYRRILVATAGSPYATAEVETADAFAALTQARLTLLMVLPPDASGGREEQAHRYLEDLGAITTAETDFVVARGSDIAQTILTAAADHELIVLGATRRVQLRRIFSRDLVGGIAHEVAERAEASVLVTKDPTAPQRISTEVGRWLGGSTPMAPQTRVRRPGEEEAGGGEAR